MTVVNARARLGAKDAADATAMPAGSVRLIAVLLGSTFVVILNETIMSVALPDLMREFEVRATTAQWLTTIFLLTMAVVIPVSGWALTRFSLRAVFIAAMSAFTLGTAAAATAPVFEVLVAARAIQACGTALMIPLLITTVMSIVPEGRRGQMMGVISIVISVAPAVGPTISGLILQQLSWRWMFWIVLPIAAAALAAGALWVRNVNEQSRSRLDAISVVLSALAFGGVIYGLSGLGESGSGHGPIPPWAALVIGAASMTVFVVRQLKLRDRSLLDLRAFGSGTFALSIVLMAVAFMTLFGVLVLLPFFLQNSLGLSTLDTGLVLLPGGVVMGVMAPFVGRAYDHFGARPLVLPGAVVISAGLWLMTTLDSSSGRGIVIAFHVVLFAGLALTLTPLMTSALGSLPVHLYSHGSAILSTAQQVAGAAGTALFITLMTRRTTSATSDGSSLSEATADGVHVAFVCAAVISLVAVAIAVFVRDPKTAAPEPAEPELRRSRT